MTDSSNTALRKDLQLRDVYAISTGAMFSSGFFLLPGLASMQTGSTVVLAYLVAGILILPAMFAVAELSTAMPRAGGAYFFLDRALGPLFGTIGGLGTWLALVLKSAFALIGMGAYLAIFFDVPVEPLAVALTVVFAAVNIFGAKEGARLQRVLVYTLVGILVFFTVKGLWVSMFGQSPSVISDRLAPPESLTMSGFAATIGIVFVSYAGLTKVASVAEEVENPGRNIPLGMFLSLATATAIYVLGIAVMVLVIDPAAFASDLTPVATASESILSWAPRWLGLGAIVVAATAAFASTGNAGIMSASRYPLAMARDRLVPERLAHLGRFKTPTVAIVVTSGFMIFAIVAFDIGTVAKLASAFQLLLFALLNLAVIVMRESKIEGYHPTYRARLYPFMQIAGIIIPFGLIAMMGVVAMAFTAAVIALCVAWFYAYARPRVQRRGAIFHCFERLGHLRHHDLADELDQIRRECQAQELALANHSPDDASMGGGSGPPERIRAVA